LGFFLGKKERK